MKHFKPLYSYFSRNTIKQCRKSQPYQWKSIRIILEQIALCYVASEVLGYPIYTIFSHIMFKAFSFLKISIARLKRALWALRFPGTLDSCPHITLSVGLCSEWPYTLKRILPCSHWCMSYDYTWFNKEPWKVHFCSSYIFHDTCNS